MRLRRYQRTAGWQMPLRVSIVMGVTMACASSSLGKEDPSRGSALEADISLTGGPAEIDARYQLRGTTLSLLLPRGEDGAMAGLFHLDLGQRHPLLAALARLPATPSGPPARPGMPVLRVVVRDPSRGDSPQQIVATRPPVDPSLAAITRELALCEQNARNVPSVTLAVAVEAPVQTGNSGPQTVKVRLTCRGTHGATVRLDPSAVLLQATAEPEPPPVGATPLPPQWTVASAPTSGSSPQELKAGEHLDFTLVLTGPATKPRVVRALMNGSVTLRAGNKSEEVRMSLASKAVRLPSLPVQRSR
jgi:hypothetical protein